ncbi:DBH-like monooxygenase protein 1 [Quaeritorhiza haematococci]|nr:DBH-like monooxygenase protein 1 [Quaeritorhiza haematococci]
MFRSLILIYALLVATAAAHSIRIRIPPLGPALSWEIINNDKIVFNVSAPTTGWVGIGFKPVSKGKSMLDANVVVGWVSDLTGAATLTIGQTGSTRTMPTLGQDQSGTLTILQGIQQQNITFLSFSLPLKPQNPAFFDFSANRESLYLIWAYGEADGDFGSLAIAPHRRMGVQEINVFEGESETVSSQHYIMKTHGILMTLVWGAFMPLAIIIRRYFKSYRWATPVHALTIAASLVLIIAAVSLLGAKRPFVVGGHQIFGLILVVWAITIQPIMGLILSIRQKSTGLLVSFHAVSGSVLVVGGNVNCLVGLVQKLNVDSYVIVWYAVWLFFGVLLPVYFLEKRDKKVRRRNAKAPAKQDIPTASAVVTTITPTNASSETLNVTIEPGTGDDTRPSAPTPLDPEIACETAELAPTPQPPPQHRDGNPRPHDTVRFIFLLVAVIMLICGFVFLALFIENTGIKHGFANYNISTIEVPSQIASTDDITNKLDATFESYRIPTLNKTYICRFVELPVDRMYHIIAYDVLITQPKYVQSMVLLNAPGVDNDIKEPFACKDMPEDFYPIVSWTRGGLASGRLPREAGIPIGRFTQTKRFILQILYNNPDANAGMIDSSGFRIHITSQLRPFDAGILKLGSKDIKIPGLTSQYQVSSACQSSSLENLLRVGQVNVFAVSAHGHTLAKRIWSEVIRGSVAEETRTAVLNQLNRPESNLLQPPTSAFNASVPGSDSNMPFLSVESALLSISASASALAVNASFTPVPPNRIDDATVSRYAFGTLGFNPERPEAIPVNFALYKNDTIVTVCEYDSSQRVAETSFGASPIDEMCTMFIAY